MKRVTIILILGILIISAIGLFLFCKNRNLTVNIETGRVEQQVQISEIPKTLSIEVYFVQIVNGQEMVVPVQREIPYTTAAARVAIEELLKGPLSDEKDEGYSSAINENTKLQSIEIENDTVQVDFSKQLDENVAGSAKVMAIRGQIEKTLLQFESIKDVIISVEGEIEEILQP